MVPIPRVHDLSVLNERLLARCLERLDALEQGERTAAQDALRRRLIRFDAVKHLLLARIERRPARLDLTRYPHLPLPFVAATRSADAMPYVRTAA